MKKWLRPTLLVLGLPLLIWLLVTWFVGYKTEQAIRQALAPVNAGSTHTLVDYQRTLFSAQAITLSNVSTTPLGTWTDALRLRHNIKHGPLVWRTASADDAAEFAVADRSLLPALSHWQTQPDLTTIDADDRRLLQQTFNGQMPLLAESVFSYDGTVDYQARLASLRAETALDERFELAGFSLAGQFNAELMQQDKIHINTDDIRISNEDSALVLPKLNITLDNEDVEQRINFAADKVLLQIAETDENVLFNMAGETRYTRDGKEVAGQLALKLDEFSTPRYPLKRVNVAADFSGINAVGLQWVSQLQQRLQDTQAQLGWYEEEIEMPESRRAMRQLDVEVETIANELLQVLFHKMLQPDQSRLSYTFDVATGLGDLQKTAELAYAGTERRMALGKVMDYGLADWLKLVRGQVQFEMDQLMLPAELEPMIHYPLQKQALLQEDDQYRMSLRLTGYDAELNGKVYAYDSLADKINPSLSALFNRAESSVPADVMSRIETHGLTDEVLQALENEDGMPAETLELLRQLKVMNEKLQ